MRTEPCMVCGRPSTHFLVVKEPGGEVYDTAGDLCDECAYLASEGHDPWLAQGIARPDGQAPERASASTERTEREAAADDA